ncbi:MAG: prepilin-type N-terminal cleavage/methylation domain-containing protein [Candidatus Omnitrophica bacterium]|nr:prepilin-type N-terminal cleavage/methylation domain-containing protein [Candidatus Omnitrophota bacterium]
MRKGFTLIELVVVIIIVGVLASIGLTQYTKVVEKGHAAEARTILGSLRSLQIAANLENGAYETNMANLDASIQTACATGTHYFTYACAASGTCTATRCTTAGKAPVGPSAYTKTLAVDGTWGGTGVALGY